MLLQFVKPNTFFSLASSFKFVSSVCTMSSVQLSNPLSCPRKSFSMETTKTSSYQYSLNKNKILTKDQQDFYEAQGYLLIPKLIGNDVLDRCRDRFVDLCEGRADKGNMLLMKDVSLAKQGGVKGEYLYNKAQDFAYDDVFQTYIMHDKLLDIVESFIGPNIRAIHSMLINKPPDAGTLTSRHPLHQDLHYFPHRPANRIVASWTAMESVTEDNGCLFVLPGSHHNPGVLHQHDYPNWEGGVNAMYHGVQGFDSHPKLNLCMEKGDTVFFHPLLIHGSGMNRTKGFRKAISCHYAAAECHYIDVRGTTQDNIANEIEQIALKKFGVELKFEEIWDAKSRLVRGIEQMTSKL
uniref:phytanoyl-CoA dioxygenase n=1 Tax=Cacopsylla melanoneura TaxID=428564 RepID=A0A8D8W6G7_9HEMI